MIWGKMAGARR